MREAREGTKIVQNGGERGRFHHKQNLLGYLLVLSCKSQYGDWSRVRVGLMVRLSTKSSTRCSHNFEMVLQIESSIDLHSKLDVLNVAF